MGIRVWFVEWFSAGGRELRLIPIGTCKEYLEARNTRSSLDKHTHMFTRPRILMQPKEYVFCQSIFGRSDGGNYETPEI
jgi:hypothetical protein